MPALMHVTTRDRNLLGLLAHLLAAHELGVRNLVVITGDPPKMGDFPDATPVYDLDSIGLLRLIARLNRGFDPGGKPLGAATRFLCATGAEPAALDYERELARLRAEGRRGRRARDDAAGLRPRRCSSASSTTSRRSGCRCWSACCRSRATATPSSCTTRCRACTCPSRSASACARPAAGRAARDEGVAIAREMLSAVKDRVAGRVHHAAVRALRAGARGHRGHRALMRSRLRRRSARLVARCLLACASVGCVSVAAPEQPFTDPGAALSLQSQARERVQSIRAEARDRSARQGGAHQGHGADVRRAPRQRALRRDDAVRPGGGADQRRRAVRVRRSAQQALPHRRRPARRTSRACSTCRSRVEQTTLLLLGGTPVIAHDQRDDRLARRRLLPHRRCAANGRPAGGRPRHHESTTPSSRRSARS